MNSLLAFAPFLSLSAAVALVIGAHLARWSVALVFLLVGSGVATAWWIGFGQLLINEPLWGIRFDALASLGTQIILPAIIIVAYLAIKSSAVDRQLSALLLVLIAGVGAMASIVSHHWMVLFVAIQCMSIPIYALIAGDGSDQKAVSAALRYLLLSTISMAIMLFGILLLYAATGSADFYEQSVFIQSSGLSRLIILGFSLVLVGLAFKLSILPFHLWAPEVYQGAPYFVVSLMVVIAKSAVLVAFLRIWLLLFNGRSSALSHMIGMMAICSMWVGSSMMLTQKKPLRLIAFLSISHMGFLLVALLAGSLAGVEAIFIDLIAFSLAVLVLLASLRSLDFDDFSGLAHKKPWLALSIGLAFLSLAGTPLTAGFIGKYSIIKAGLAANLWQYVPHMVLTSLLSIVALIRLVFLMLQPNQETPTTKLSLSELGIVLGTVILLVIGMGPEGLIIWIKQEMTGLADLAHYVARP